MSDANPAAVPATWRIVLAFLLDFVTAFFVFGFLVAKLSGGMTPDGFSFRARQPWHCLRWSSPIT